jgi:hypothetical protein
MTFAVLQPTMFMQTHENGWSEVGKQVRFRLPYSLNPDHNSSQAWMKTEVMVEANTTNSASYANFTNGTGNDQFRLREAFVQAGNVLQDSRTPSSGQTKDTTVANTLISRTFIPWI